MYSKEGNLIRLFGMLLLILVLCHYSACVWRALSTKWQDSAVAADDEEYEEVHALEEEEDEFGEHTVETVESFVPSPIVTTRKKAKSPTASLTRKEVQSKVRGSQDYSMNFESLAVTHKPKEHTTTHGGHANENYDNEEFEEYQDDEN